MKAMKIVVVVVFVAAIMGWVRGGGASSLFEWLPLVGGHAPGLYDVGAGLMIIIAIWGVSRIARIEHSSTKSNHRYEVVEAEIDDD